MRRILSVGVVLVVVAIAALATGATQKRKSFTYRIVFDNAFGLVEGGDFRVGGVSVGKTSKFDVQKKPGKAPKAVATVNITKVGFGDFRKDASCTIRPQGLIGEFYVDCQPGRSPNRLPQNGVVPVENTESTIPLDLVNNIMRRPVRERFRLILTELGTGLAGRPQDLQEVLRRAHPGLRETSRVLRILGDQNEVIAKFIQDSDTIMQELAGNRRDVSRFVTEAGETAEIAATRRTQLRESFRKLPTFLDELKPTMARLGQLSDEQVPLLADLRQATPDLNTFLARLGPFSEASRPALRSLGRAGTVGTRAFREGKEEIRELKLLARDAPGAFKPLRQFLQTMDDRQRAIEVDGRASVDGPPVPDPTAIAPGGGGGFTGLEAIFNFVYWSGMSLNGYDDVSHVLRVSVALPGGGECVNLENDVDPNSEKFKKCTQWIGPNLPGLTAPDFTQSSSRLAKLRRESAKPARKLGERRPAGGPEAGALPGQRDISQPQVVLPPELRKLIDELPRQDKRRSQQRVGQVLGEVPGAGRGGQPTPQPGAGSQDTQLLDFLLAP